MLYEPVKRLTGIHNIFQQALGASQKVFEYLDNEQQVRERPSAVRLAKFERRFILTTSYSAIPACPMASCSTRSNWK